MKTKAHILFDKTKSSLKILFALKKNIKSVKINQANFFIVIGGDGFNLKILKKFYNFKKPFYGVNSGSYGFLMNKYSKVKTHKNLHLAKTIRINPLKMTVKNKFNQTKKSIAINEVSVLRQSRQASSVCIFNGKKKIIKNASTFIKHGGIAYWDFIVFKHNEHQIYKCKKYSEELGFNKFKIISELY